MSDDKKLLVIWHSRTGASEQMAKAAALHDNARPMRACDVSVEDILRSAGYLFVCPENLGTMSGEMKEMFDRTYYHVLGKIEGRPYAVIIAAGSDGAGAQRQIERIATGWRLKQVADTMVINFAAQTPGEILRKKSVTRQVLNESKAVGELLCEGIDLGVF